MQDIRFAVRVSISSPGLTAVAVLTLGVGIAASSTVFSWIDSVVLRPYPGVTDTRGLARVETLTATGERPANGATSYLDYRDYRENLKLVSGIAVGRFTPVTVGADGQAERVWAELVSENYFDVLRVKPVLGRALLAAEAAPGAFPVVVISHRMWQTRFAGRPDVLGTVVRINRRQLTIVGVAPPEFRGSTAGFVYDAWMPLGMASEMGTGPTLTYRGCRDLTSTLVRLAPGVTVEQARSELGAVARRLASAYPETNAGVEATLVPMWAGYLGAQGFLLKPLAILAAACALLLVLACANVANLLLARAVSRQNELAVRLALGAGRGRLVRQLLTETLLLAGCGAAAGLLLTAWLRQSLNLLLPPVDFPFDLGGRLGGRTLGFTLLLVVATTVASGLAPALLSVRGALAESLNEGGRGGVGGRRAHRLREVLAGVEVAVATAAVVGAVLFVRSFENARRLEPGFETRNVALARFHLSSAGYDATEQRRFCRTLRERMAAAPGVAGVTYTDFVPLASPASSPQDQLEIDGYVPAPGEQMIFHRATVPPGYFEFMGIRLLEGREFSERDEGAAPGVVIVNETFARRYFGGRSPLGRVVRLKGANASATVVGTVRDSKYDAPTEAAAPYFYLPFQQWFSPGLEFAFLVRTGGDPLGVLPELRRQALALNPDAVFEPARLTDAIGYSLYAQRLAARLLSVVGGLCLLLAAAGLYGVVSYGVSQRTREFGIRMALGASPSSLARMVARESLRIAVPGLLAGSALVAAGAGVASGLLVGVSARDPLTHAGGAAFLLATILLASYWPARRAVRVDPMTAVRCQ